MLSLMFALQALTEVEDIPCNKQPYPEITNVEAQFQRMSLPTRASAVQITGPTSANNYFVQTVLLDYNDGSGRFEIVHPKKHEPTFSVVIDDTIINLEKADLSVTYAHWSNKCFKSHALLPIKTTKL